MTARRIEPVSHVDRQREPRGRFAPSPTGPLHLGNLRTAVVAWLGATSVGGTMLVRMEDLDLVTSSPAHEASQIADLVSLGIVSAAAVVRQSERFDRYRSAIAELTDRGSTYPCYCSRREIREAASAPNDSAMPDGAYPGTCRGLTDADRAHRERDGRRPAVRLRTNGESYEFEDLIAGTTAGVVDDVVLQRNDGVPAYNLAVVVDDAAQGVTQVVRGDDLLSSTPRQLHLQYLLGLDHPTYAHVPLVLGADGTRLAKRHGAVTLGDLAARGVDASAVLTCLLDSLGPAVNATTLADAVGTFAFDRVPRVPWRPTATDLGGGPAADPDTTHPV